MSEKSKNKPETIDQNLHLPTSYEGDHNFALDSSILRENAFYRFYQHLGEKEVGKNTGPVVEWAMRPWSKVKPDESGWAEWCAAAVCTAYLEAGSSQIKDLASTNANTLWQRLVKRGQAFSLSESSIPALGDLVFFERNGKVYHVGLVKEYDPKTKRLITLEGNANDAVRLCVRTTFHGFAHITE